MQGCFVVLWGRQQGEREGGGEEGGRGGAPHRDLVTETCITIYVLYRKYMRFEEIYLVKVYGLKKRRIQDSEELVFESVRDILELSCSQVTRLNSHD